MAYELSGKVKVILDPQTFASGFTKREVVVTVEDGKYPQDICLECLKEKAALLDELKVGDHVQVSFDIRGREYNGRYFNNLQAWRLQKTDAAAAGPDDDPSQFPDADMVGVDEVDDKIPF